MNTADVTAVLPHRYPFLLVDRILSCEPQKTLVALKNVTINEPFFQGHFPGHSVMPGVLIIEAMAQTCGLLLAHSLSPAPDKPPVYYLAGVDQARFRAPVVPGDTLTIHANMLMCRRSFSKYASQVYCGDNLVAEAELLCAQAPE